MTLSESSALEQFQFLEKVALECGDDCGIHEEEYTNEGICVLQCDLWIKLLMILSNW